MATDERDPVMEAVALTPETALPLFWQWNDDLHIVDTAERDGILASWESDRAELTRLRDLNAKLVLEAQIHAGEARAANASLYECYQAVSGATGEKGNWNGSRPVVEELTRLRAQVETLTEERDTIGKAMELVRDDYHRVRLERKERDADLAALVPPALDLLTGGGDFGELECGPDKLDAARAALARVEARNG